jgi:hypothetical protein
MDFVSASVAKMTAYFMDRWGKAGGYTQISRHDLSTFDLKASARNTPVWQRAVFEIALSEFAETVPIRTRVFKAISLARERGVDIPLSVLEAKAASTDANFKNLENRCHKIMQHLELFPDIDPYEPHDLSVLCDAVIVGRFDVAAQIFVSAENKTKRAWIRKLRIH